VVSADEEEQEEQEKQDEQVLVFAIKNARGDCKLTKMWVCVRWAHSGKAGEHATPSPGSALCGPAASTGRSKFFCRICQDLGEKFVPDIGHSERS
jgi:hypothetical protein